MHLGGFLIFTKKGKASRFAPTVNLFTTILLRNYILFHVKRYIHIVFNSLHAGHFYMFFLLLFADFFKNNLLH